MGFWSLLEVASMPVLQFLLIGLIGAVLASNYFNILTADARRDMNKIVFHVFTPSLIFSGLAKTITFGDLITWWFMPVNIGVSFLVGGLLGWLAVKILKPERHIENLIIACCSAGNLGNLFLIIIPAVCDEDGSPFGEPSICHKYALSYVSMSVAIGGLFIWTSTYRIMMGTVDASCKLTGENDGLPEIIKIEKLADDDQQKQITLSLLPNGINSKTKMHLWGKIRGTLHQIAEELMAPPMIAAMVGFIVGVIPWLKSLISESSSPLRVVQDSLTLLADGTVPSATLILGGNLTKGLRKSNVKPSAILAIMFVRFVILPVVGIVVVKSAAALGFLPQDPLYHYVLLLQFAIPPAMAIGTMSQLFDVAQEECSFIFLWTYLVAAPALTIWSTIFMYILS